MSELWNGFQFWTYILMTHHGAEVTTAVLYGIAHAITRRLSLATARKITGLPN